MPSAVIMGRNRLLLPDYYYSKTYAPAFRTRTTWPVTLAIEPSTKKINYSTECQSIPDELV